MCWSSSDKFISLQEKGRAHIAERGQWFWGFRVWIQRVEGGFFKSGEFNWKDVVTRLFRCSNVKVQKQVLITKVSFIKICLCRCLSGNSEANDWFPGLSSWTSICWNPVKSRWHAWSLVLAMAVKLCGPGRSQLPLSCPVKRGGHCVWYSLSHLHSACQISSFQAEILNHCKW